MFIQTIRNFFSKDIIPLGRWHRIYDQRILSRRIDLANYDHCGPCGNDDKIPITKQGNKSKSKSLSTQHLPVGKPNDVKFDAKLGAFK